MVGLVAEALYQLGAEHMLVVHCGGLDELAPVAVATVATVTRAGVSTGSLDPFALGFAKCSLSDLKGGDRKENAETLRLVLAGKLPGAVTDTVVLNAGAGLHVAGVAASVAEGCAMAKEAVLAGRPMQTLEAWVDAARDCANYEPGQF
jgi:anthranilate phosphoribosyltransferase